MQSGKCLKILKAHTGEITSVSYSRNGQRIASKGNDERICIWKADENILLATIQLIADKVSVGILVTTPPDEIARSGWFWTDKLELIEQINTAKVSKDGSEAEVLPDDNPDRLNYIKLFNCQDGDMARLNDWVEYNRLINQINGQKELTNKKVFLKHHQQKQIS